MPPTPEGTLGPFFPGAFSSGLPQNLWDVSPLAAHHPAGEPIVLSLRVLDAAGQAVPSAIVETWQANAAGRYRHPADRSAQPLDPQFDGFARLRTDAEGIVHLHTVKPGPHAAGDDGALLRAPHIRLTIFASGIDRVATQIFFDGEPLNETDPVLQSIPEAALRERLIARPPDQPSGDARVYALDIVLRGEHETPFFEEWAA